MNPPWKGFKFDTSKYISLPSLGRPTQARIAALEDLVRHCWVHSGYRDCGFDQMDSDQKQLYRAVIARAPE